MAHRTAWALNASSLPSDRIPPRKTTPKPKVKGGNAPASSASNGSGGIPKSKEVIKLEALKDSLQKLVSHGMVPEKDPKGGCFCQGNVQLNLRVQLTSYASHRPLAFTIIVYCCMYTMWFAFMHAQSSHPLLSIMPIASSVPTGAAEHAGISGN